MNIIDTFGIQPILLLAQIVNFLILLFLLNKFLYKPILKTLQNRQHQIAESLKNAEQIELNLQKSEDDRLKKLQKATDEAKEIIQDAKEAANQIIDEAHQKAAADITFLVEKTKAEIEAERQSLNQAIRADLSRMLTLGLEKVANISLNKANQEKVLKKVIQDL